MTGPILAAVLSDLEHHQNPTVLCAFRHFVQKGALSWKTKK